MNPIELLWVLWILYLLMAGLAGIQFMRKPGLMIGIPSFVLAGCAVVQGFILCRYF